MAYPTRADAQKADLAARSAQRDAEEARLAARNDAALARLMDGYHDQAIRIDWKRAVVNEIIGSLRAGICRSEDHEGHPKCLAAMSIIRDLLRLFDGPSAPGDPDLA